MRDNILFIKDGIRYRKNQIIRMGLNTEALAEAQGFEVIQNIIPEYNIYLEEITDIGELNGRINWEVTPLSEEGLSAMVPRMRMDVLKELKDKMSSAYARGYTCDTLGEMYRYDSDKAYDLVNITMYKVAGVPTEITCTNEETRVKEPVLHTVEQINDVFNAALLLANHKKVYWAKSVIMEKAMDYDSVLKVKHAVTLEDVAALFPVTEDSE